MAAPSNLIGSIPRTELAKIFTQPRVRAAFEKLIDDVQSSIPTSLTDLTGAVAEIQGLELVSRSIASRALALVKQAMQSSQEGPPVPVGLKLSDIDNRIMSILPPFPTKTDLGLGNVDNTSLSTWPGSTNVTTLGTVTTGTWNAGVIAPLYGGTGLSSYAIGDLIYASGTGTLSRLADVVTGNALISGGVGVAPSWGKIDLTAAVSNVLPVANGGTGVSSLSSLTANPSASVGLAAVNGSASTFMRSDAAPALSVTISPTWTGNHTFAPASGNTLFSAGAILKGVSSTLTVAGAGTGVVFADAAAGANTALVRNTTTATSAPNLMLARSRSGTVGSAATAVISADTLANIVGAGADGTNFVQATGILSQVDGAVSAGVVPGRLLFQTANSAGTLTEGMRLDSNQNLGVGLTPGGSYKVEINGALSISSTTLIRSATSLTNGAAAASGTLTNAPAAGNPTKWVPINDAGITRYIPAW